MVNRDTARERRTGVDMAVAAQHRSLAQYHAITDIAIVSYVGARHQEAIASQPSKSVFLLRSAVDRYALANHIPITDDDLCWALAVANVLWFSSNHTTRPQNIVFA